MVVDDALAAPVLEPVLFRQGEPPKAGLADGEDHLALPNHIHAHNGVVVQQSHNLHAPGAAAHGTHIVFVHAQGHAVSGGHNQVVVARGNLYPGQRIALVQVHGNQARLAHIVKERELGALHHAPAGDHDQVFIIVQIFQPQHGGNVLL